MSEPGDVLLDPAAPYPDLAEIREALRQRDWAGVRKVLDRVPPRARDMLIMFAGDEKDLEGFLREVLAADPGDTGAAALLGCHLTGVGWDIRTGARAKNVSREQFGEFHEWLRKAEQVLIDAAARNPSDPAVWQARLTTARGLELGLAETRRRYDRLKAIDPHPYFGQLAFLQTLCPKWSGSWEMLHAWCQEEMMAAPPGTVQGALVAMGHLEYWADLRGAEAQAHLKNPKMRAGLHEAAARSIFHPEFRLDPGWVNAVSTFAMGFSLIRDEPAAAAAFRLLGPYASRSPWFYLSGDPATAVRERRARAYAAVPGSETR